MRSRSAIAMASHGGDMVLVDGLGAEGKAILRKRSRGGEIVSHRLLDAPLALPVAWWDGANYIVGGLRCPGWEGEEATGLEWISSYCGTVTYSCFRWSGSESAPDMIGEADAGPFGLLSLAAAGERSALLRRAGGAGFVRVQTEASSARFDQIAFDSYAPGICAEGSGYIAFALPPVSPSFPANPAPATDLRRFALSPSEREWSPQPVSANDLRSFRDVVFAGCDGGEAVLVAHQSLTEVAYLGFSLGDPSEPPRIVKPKGLDPSSSLGMVGSHFVGLVRVAEPASFRLVAIESGVVLTLADFPGWIEAPDVLAVSDFEVAYLSGGGRGSVQI
ncbi:MAG: hypothetical protein KDA94_14880, partial [Acidimicrobiales bacterium]|nr:hypothetical protein [Acidimicrobiales bacterium]